MEDDSRAIPTCFPQAEEPSVVDPVDPSRDVKLDGFEVPPRTTPIDHYGLVELLIVSCYAAGCPRSSDGGQPAALTK